MNGRAEIMHEAGQGQLGRADSPAQAGIGFQHDNGKALLSQANRRRQAIGTRPDHDRVIGGPMRHKTASNI